VDGEEKRGIISMIINREAESKRMQIALRWALEYLESYDHVGTGSEPSAKDMRDYEEKLETIRTMVDVPRETKMTLREHFWPSEESDNHG
jgi:hypothetical protein